MKKQSKVENATGIRAVRVLENYGGALTSEQRILPGVYAEDDPALFGLAEYLVDNRFAEWSDEVVAQAVEPIEAEPVEPDDSVES